MKTKFKYILFLAYIIVSCSSVFAQAGGDVVRGKVVSDTGEELISATVLEVDKTDRVVGHTQTDMNGDFSMKISSNQNFLKVNYIGFGQQRVQIGDKRSFNIVLKEDNLLTEVVIVKEVTSSSGTLDIPQREVGFAMQKINTKDFEGLQVASIDDALQGQIAGLDIIGSGDVGRGTSMRIRGTASINANAEPLIVVNGIPREDLSVRESGIDIATANQDQFAELLSVNPDDILEISVLKDAASTAVWGSRGANGVLLITTKKGASGPTRVNYTYKFTGAKQPKGLKMLNGDDYTIMMKQALFNTRLSSTDANVREFNYLPAGSPDFADAEYYNRNTDWRDAVIQPGHTHDHYLVISGGGEKATFRLAGGYMTQKGTIIGQGLERFSTRMDLDYYVSSRIRFTSEFAFTYTDNDRNWTDEGGILEIAYKKMPNMAIYKSDGGYFNLNQNNTDLPQGDGDAKKDQKLYRNPVALAKLGKDNLKTYNIQPVLRLRYDLLDPEQQMLQYNVWVSFQMRNERAHKFLPKEVSTKQVGSDEINKSNVKDSENFVIQTENKLTWQPKFSNEDHSMLLYGAVQTSSGNGNVQEVESYGSALSIIDDPSAGAKIKKIETSLSQIRSIGIIGQFHYSYKGKYIADFSIRRDGSTRFGKENKYGNFPGAYLRWNISEESFMDFSNDWLDMLSIRPSWGITGNQPAYDYLHFSKYKADEGYMGLDVTRPDNIRLSNLKWEKTTGYNLGFDVNLLNYTYNLDVNFYIQRTENLLFKDAVIPSTSGFTSIPYRNAGTMDNKGWEVNLNANRFVKLKDFTFDARFNIAGSNNTLVRLDDDILRSLNKEYEYKSKDIYTTPYRQMLVKDKSYGSIYGFRYKGVYEYGIDGREQEEIADLVNKGYKLPVVRTQSGEPLKDGDGNYMPVYYNYSQNGGVARYQFQGGDAIYEDVNNDGVIDEYDIVYLGNSNPKLNGGFGFTVRWKQLSFDLFANFRYGNKIINTARRNAESMAAYDNQSIAVNWRWKKEGDPTWLLPRASSERMPNNDIVLTYNSLPSDRFVEDGSFLRLKYIRINYAFPSASIKKFGLRQLNLYLTVNNLLCLTKYQGVDPEVDYEGLGISEDKSITPRSKDFTVGITVGF